MMDFSFNFTTILSFVRDIFVTVFIEEVVRTEDEEENPKGSEK